MYLKYVKTSLLTTVKKVGQILFVIGQPPLFAIKILLWTIYWLGVQGLKILESTWEIFLGILETTFWFLKVFRGIKIKLGIKRPKISFPKVTIPQKITYLAIGAAVTFIFLFIPFWVRTKLDNLPSPKLLAVREIPVSTKIYDRNGVLLYQVYSDENRSLIALNQLPKFLVQATLSIEDKNFYYHLGFDPVGIARATFANAYGNPQGGSTITQQLIRSALLTSERTWQRKVKEIFLSFWAERLYSKDKILEMYLNQIPYGGTAYGIEAAAQTYFGKHAKDLTLGESALLAGLSSSPTTYSPFGTRPELARDRQKQVLNAMVEENYITVNQANNALAEELKFSSAQTSIKAPHFVMYVRDLLSKKYGDRKVQQGGLEVATTLDINIQKEVETIVSSEVEKQKYLNVGNGAALVANPKNGDILAMVGSVDFFDITHDGNVNVVLAQRSPGSSIKPLNYALAIEKNLITPSTIINDSPVSYRNYSPGNYDNKFHGNVTIRTALASSYNIPAVKVLDKNGVENFLDFAKKLGISTFNDYSRYGLSVTLGGGEVTMLDMATAYTAFANQGKKTELNPILKVTDYQGRVLEDHLKNDNRVMSEKTAFMISDILSDNNARSPAFGPNSSLVIPGHTVSVKTGTTQEKRDNWTIGYTPSILTAVWVGNNNNSPMSMALESGNTGAAAIWNPIMQYLLKDKPDEGLTLPSDMIPVQICALNGLLPCANCPYVRTEYFVRGSEPKQACNFTKEEVDKILHPEVEKKP